MFTFEQTATPKAAITQSWKRSVLMNSKDVLADFAHQLRQPLSMLETLTFYLSLVTSPEDGRVQAQLQRVHSEVARVEQILRDGIRSLHDHFSTQEAINPS